MTVSIQHEGEIAAVSVNNPPVNALCQVLRQGLWDAVGMDADLSVPRGGADLRRLHLHDSKAGPVTYCL